MHNVSVMVVVISKMLSSLITSNGKKETKHRPMLVALVVFIGASRAGRFIDGHALCELIFSFTFARRGGNAIRYRGNR